MSKLSKASIEIIQCWSAFQFQKFLDGKLIEVSPWIKTNSLSEDDRKLTDSVGLTEKEPSYPCPDCGTELVSGYGGGVHCPNSDCSYISHF